ncbi:hypothetical protein [Sphingomonas oligophenolica]|uniref:O-antigen ligase domain-containing protein n=1 Tax=Sphingomonas oligophenolica TaxID=301154 RepID=A0A502C3N2_9SPHN|nr:hypothetical protein [Sphingomonas oligophenolica]TPG08125.1 hypothetical protein EAH84_14220 [Sphingomonas oligophenolica]
MTSEPGLLAFVTKGLLFLTMAVCVVVPHSFQVPTAGLILVTAFFAVLGLKRSPWLDKLMLTYYAGTAVTAFYLWLGYTNGAPREAFSQVLLVYIISPLLWWLIGASLMQRVGQDKLIRWLILLTWLALASVVLFFYAFLTFGKDSVRFLTEDANVNVQGGFAGASMLVYGSLIFLSGSYFAEPTMVRSRVARLIFPAALIVCAITSGRSAFILAIPIGALVGLALRSGLAVAMSEAERKQTSLLPILLVLVAGVGGLMVLSLIFAQIDLRLIVNLFWDKLTSGGGDVRVEQARALWEGIERSYGLGQGHGLGVRYLRSDEFPWRYELIPLASMLRVGIMGTAVYLSPFILYAALLSQRFAERRITRNDIYFAGGFFSVAVAAFTNPYIESFIFQWMFFVPVIALGIDLLPNQVPHRS